MADLYTIGDLVRCTVTFTQSGVNVDPAAVTITIKDPTGTETSHTPVKDSVGVYHYDVDVETAGTWGYRGAGTGTNQAAIEASFLVAPSNF